ncbi:MAG: dipeptidase [Rhodanobacter sp.]
MERIGMTTESTSGLARATDTPFPIFAGHSGFITALAGYGYDIQAAAMGESAALAVPDSRLAGEAGLAGGVFEVFAPPLDPPTFRKTEAGFEVDYPPELDRHYALDQTLAGIDALLRLQRASPARFRLVRTAGELAAAREEGAFAIVLHLADADSLDTGLRTLATFHEAGVRSLAISWSRRNAFGHGAPYRRPGTPAIGPGLTGAGIRLVHACNELGIVIDLAHLNEAGFQDVARHSRAPLVVSHGAAHALSPTSRGTTDRQLDAIAASGGLIGVSMEGVDTTPSGRVGDMVRQIDYLLGRMGPDHVALGSDLYVRPGAGHSGGKSMLPELLASLRDAGHDAATIAAITWANWLRVFTATWR